MAVHVEMEVPTEPHALQAAVEGLTSLNAELMRAGGVAGRRSAYPPLYSSGVVYRREKPGCEDWQNADRLLDAGEGDCEDLAAYRAAELRVLGEDARVVVQPTGPGMYHAVVGRESGDIEDPSRILIDMEKNMKAKPRFTLKQIGNHHMAAIELPLTSGDTVRCAELGFDPWGALSKVLSTVVDVVTSPQVQSLLPPQAGMAINAVKMISDMSVQALEKLLDDDRSTPAQRKIAQKVLEAKRDSTVAGATTDHRTNPAYLPGGKYGRPLTAPPAAPTGTYTGSRSVSVPTGTVQPTAGQVDPMTGLMWTGDHWARPSATAVSPANPSDPYNPYAPYAPVDQTAPPGYPPSPYGSPYGGYPPPGPYGSPYGGYPPPMYPSPYGGYPPPMYPSPYGGYPPPMYPSPYGGYPPVYPTVPPGWDQSAAMQPQPLSADEAAAITLWGSGSFAQGAFPGYDQSGQGAWT